jgi:hypothetical protein
MDPFCLKLQVERSSYIRAYTGGVHSSIGIQIKQSTNQPKPFTYPEIQPEACIATERREQMKHKIEPFSVKINKTTTIGQKKNPPISPKQ